MVESKKNNNFYVITGGPGVGKTTLLEELKTKNYEVVPEIARELIKEQKEINGEALPWKNKKRYRDLMFERSIKSFEEIDKRENKENLTFFDRGFLDTICYSKLIQLEISPQMESYADNWRYNKKVFILPPWQEIYETDSERKQDWNEAVLTYEKMVETYERYGYDIVEVPKRPVIERTDFIVNLLGENTKPTNC